MARILIVDDEPTILRVLDVLLKTKGYEVETCGGGEEARGLIEQGGFDLMLADIRMTPVSGLQFLGLVQKKYPDIPVIMMTGFASVNTAIGAMNRGAFDYVTKPFEVDALLATVQRALAQVESTLSATGGSGAAGSRYHLGNVIAESPCMKKACDMVKRVAPSMTTVLVRGEVGTGKKLIAHTIHEHSSRREQDFVTVNCVDRPEPVLDATLFGGPGDTSDDADGRGCFVRADGGTIFLQGVDRISRVIQDKLLMVIESKRVQLAGSGECPVDVRIIAATAEDLHDLVDRGEYNETLFYRLSCVPIAVDPLRERRQDIMPLVRDILARNMPEGCDQPAIDSDVCAVLESYSWPGNVHELEGVIKLAARFGKGMITKRVLPQKIATTPVRAGAGQADVAADDFGDKSLIASRC